MTYASALSDISAILRDGPEGFRVSLNKLVPVPFMTPPQPDEVHSLAARRIEGINAVHAKISSTSDYDDLCIYFGARKTIEQWNATYPAVPIEYEPSLPVTSEFFPEFSCSCNNAELKPLIISPKAHMTFDDFTQWASTQTINGALSEYGALLFRGFGIPSDQFMPTFESLVGYDSLNATKDTPWSGLPYVPLHQEKADKPRDQMPETLGFFCATAPRPGSGQTILGDARRITQTFRLKAPELWGRLSTKSLTYTTRYLPPNSPYTAWATLWNPSHPVASHADDWVTRQTKELPATIQVGSETLFCNHAHLYKFTPTIWGGQINYALTRAFVYPTQGHTQYDVQLGQPSLLVDEATTILGLLKEHELKVDWQQGDLMILDNRRVLHGKLPHEGERSILTAMV